MHVDVAVRSLRHVGIGDAGPFIEQQLAGPRLALVSGKECGQLLAGGRGLGDLLAVSDEQDVARLEAAEDALAVNVRESGGLGLPGLAAIVGETLPGCLHASREHPEPAVPKVRPRSAR